MRSAIMIITMAAAVLSCNSAENKGANQIVFAQKMFDAFNAHQWQAMADCYSDSALFLDPAFGKIYLKQSRSQVVEKYALLHRVFPDIHDEIVAMYPSENKVIVEFISTGTMASGAEFKLPIITVLTFENNLIVKDGTYYDVENSSEEENSNEEENPDEAEIP